MSSEVGGTERIDLALLQALSTCGGEAQTLAEAATHCAASLRRSPLDRPFAAIYLLDPAEPRALQAMATSPGIGPVPPTCIPVAPGNLWSFAAALEREVPIVVRLLDAPANPGHQPGAASAETAAIVGLVEPHGSERLGVLTTRPC